MEEVKAINTEYKGHKFRSRLEARYAVFLDNLDINWVYELEGYQLPSGWYLPDFYLPTFNGGSFAEVKFEFNPKEIQLCRELCDITEKNVILFEGVPNTKVYKYFEKDINQKILYRHELERCMGIYTFGISVLPNPHYNKIEQYIGIPNADQAWGEDRMFVMPGYEDNNGNIPDDYLDCLGDNYLNAVDKANMARFEFVDKI